MRSETGVAVKRNLFALGCLGLCMLSCDDSKLTDWNNPTDPNGGNYHPPTAAVRVTDTLFKDPEQVIAVAASASLNSNVVRYDWKVDNDSTSYAARTDTAIRLNGIRDGSTHLLQVRAIDANGLTGEWSAPVRIHVWNRPPVLAYVEDTTLSVNRSLTVKLSATDPDGPLREYLFDTTGNGWDSSVAAPTLRITSTSEVSRKIRWGARDDLGKTTTDSFVVSFVMDRPVLVAVSDTTVSASKTLVVPLVTHLLDGSSSAVTEYLWSTNGSAWDSSSTASVSLSDTAGGALTVQWMARNSLGNFSKPDTFVVTFLHAPVITLRVDSNFTSWTGYTGALSFSWSGSIVNAPGETITWTLSGGIGGFSQLYSGTATTYIQAGIDSGVSYNYQLVGKNRFGDSSVTTGAMKALGPSGMFTDSRDGQAYRYVMIGTQKWMAQNLNYQVDSSWCPGGVASNCALYGRLYRWTSAMNLSSNYDATIWGGTLLHRGACPSGWHVPSDAEWSTLVQYVDSVALGTKLKSTDGWNLSGNGTDAYAFKALPAGFRSDSGTYGGLGYTSYFWSSSNDKTYAWSQAFYHDSTGGSRYGYGKADGFSLRCVKDN